MEMENTNQQPNSAQNQPSENIINNQRGNVPIIIGGIILLLVVGVGAFVLGQRTSNNIATSTNQQPQATITSTQTQPLLTSTAVANPTSNQMSNWKSYTSTKASYSFKYPTEWPLVNVPTYPECTVCIENIVFTPKYNPNLGDGNTAVILVFKEDKIKTLDDYVNIHVKGDSSKVNLQYTTVGGERAVSYKLSGGIPPLPVIEYAVVKNGMYYIIRLDDSAETNKNKDKNLSLFNEMLTTFKFQ